MAALLGSLIGTSESRIMVAGSLFLLSLVSGIWLGNSGGSDNVAVFTIHKLIAVLTVISIAVTVYYLREAINTSTVGLAVVVVSGLLLLCLFASGAWLSAARPVNDVILAIHRVGPILSGVSTATMIYLLTAARL